MHLLVKPSHVGSLGTHRGQRGATLIEALIAIFVLAFGVLALMVAQLRSVGSVQEAGNQTVVAQAAQTLMEGMLTNPELSLNADNQTEKSYAEYMKGNVIGYCAASGAASDYPSSEVISKADLVRTQLCRFDSDLRSKLPNASAINVQVCQGNPETGLCNQAPNVDIITVSWDMQATDSTAQAQGPVAASGVMTYRFVLPVQD